MHLDSWESARRLEHRLRYLHALRTIRVHPELDGRTLDTVHSLTESPNHPYSAGWRKGRQCNWKC